MLSFCIALALQTPAINTPAHNSSCSDCYKMTLKASSVLAFCSPWYTLFCTSTNIRKRIHTASTHQPAHTASTHSQHTQPAHISQHTSASTHQPAHTASTHSQHTSASTHQPAHTASTHQPVQHEHYVLCTACKCKIYCTFVYVCNGLCTFTVWIEYSIHV